MALQYLLGLVDLVAAFSLVLYALGFPIYPIQALAGLFLFGKGAFFIKDLFSIMDVIIAILMFVMIWTSLPIIGLSMAIWLGFKGAYSYA